MLLILAACTLPPHYPEKSRSEQSHIPHHTQKNFHKYASLIYYLPRKKTNNHLYKAAFSKPKNKPTVLTWWTGNAEVITTDLFSFPHLFTCCMGAN